MIFSAPISFDQALESRAVKASLPNDLSSEELRRVRSDIAERSNMMAHATNARFVDKVGEVVRRIMTPRGPGGKGEAMSKAEARAVLKQTLREIGYDPQGRTGMQDLGSDQRLNLVIETQVKMAAGYGQWERGQQRSVLWAFPAWELVRVGSRKEPRDWPTRWDEQGGQFYTGEGSGWAQPYSEGRMIALKSSSIWTAISVFGLPYAPFDFNSGMGLAHVGRDYCQRVGLIRRGQAVAPQRRSFASDTSKISVGQMTPDLEAALLQSLGPGYEVRGGVLRTVANERRTFQGLRINVENPKGTWREGKDAAGRPWRSLMPADYGEVTGTDGADGDPVDVFVGPDASSETVFVLDTHDPDTGIFDEHKCMLGYNSKTFALRDFAAAYSDGRGTDRARHVTPMTVGEFKAWLRSDRTQHAARSREAMN